MDIEDELEAEIDIMYSGEYSEEMSLLQFPLIPKDNFKQNSISSLSINRENEMLKIEKNIDINYLDQRAPNRSTVQVMNGQRIESNTNLVMGIFRNGTLYFTPVSHIYQFRHDFSSAEDNEITTQKRNKKDFRNQQVQKKETNEIEFTPMQIHYPNTIDSCKAIERIVSIENYMEGEVKFLQKDEYFNLLMKYINDKSITDELNEKAIPPDSEDYMNYNKKKIKRDTNIKKENDTIMSKMLEESNNKVKEETIVGEIIINTITPHDCVKYEDLIKYLYKELNVDPKNKEKVNQINKEIENYCFICTDNITNIKLCFLKNIDDEEIQELRLKLIDYFAKNNNIKKPQIKNILKECDVSIQDSKLNKLLKSFGEYKNNVWVLKSPKQI